MSNPRGYIRDGAEIYRRSFAIIRREADLARFTTEEERVAVRIIHASGIVEQRSSGGVEAFRLTCAMPMSVAMNVLVITAAFVLMLAHL